MAMHQPPFSHGLVKHAYMGEKEYQQSSSVQLAYKHTYITYIEIMKTSQVNYNNNCILLLLLLLL